MAKSKKYYSCGVCGYTAAKWLGRCPECQSWDSFVEETPPSPDVRGASPAKAVLLDQVPDDRETRFSTGVTELDRVLGGGVVAGSVALLAGEPGIGKSTLILQAAAGLGATGRRMLYVSGEESLSQIRLRAKRLGLDLSRLLVAAETNLAAIVGLAREEDWDLLAVDSVQAVQSDAQAAPGGLVQIRETAAKMIALAKSQEKPVWLVGHVTKEGAIAGPKVLEHLVDTVLYFEGERGYNLRILRTFKNRYGSVNEIGVFEMKDRGLAEVANPSALFLAERPKDAPGSVVAPTIEGTRTILVELQALVSASGLAMPRRQALGVDPNRLSLLTAVLEKKVGLRLYDRDVFVNVAGGVRVVEPAADLGLVAAVASSARDKPVDDRTVFIGEVGLAGEVRGVSRTDARLREAEKLGFEVAVLPKSDAANLKKHTKLALVGLSTVNDLLAWLDA